MYSKFEAGGACISVWTSRVYSLVGTLTQLIFGQGERRKVANGKKWRASFVFATPSLVTGACFTRKQSLFPYLL